MKNFGGGKKTIGGSDVSVGDHGRDSGGFFGGDGGGDGGGNGGGVWGLVESLKWFRTYLSIAPMHIYVADASNKR